MLHGILGEEKSNIFFITNNRDRGYLELEAVGSIENLIDMRNFLSQRRKGNIQRFRKMLISKGTVQKEEGFLKFGNNQMFVKNIGKFARYHYFSYSPS